MRQTRRTFQWLGALQVQMANASYYTVWYSNVMLALTFWYTAGYQISQQYAPWLNFWIFMVLMAASIFVFMALDYLYIFPSRIAFTNRQAYKHDNEAMDILKRVEADMIRVKNKLGVE
jgi:uncharacterized membrane protein